MAIKYIVNEIKRLSQDEGLNDLEIADTIGCSRATVNRNRIKYDIPKANVENKKDKTFICSNCHDTIHIRRKESRKLYCDKCEKIIGSNINIAE